MATRRGLGRGFESLIPTELLDESFDPTAEQDEKISDLRTIKLDEIIADPDQPRRTFDEIALEELAESIRKHGILQPIVVTPHTDGYMIVAGERRYRAAVLAGAHKIPALVRTLSNQHKLEISLIENLQRQDLNPLEVATAYLKLRDQFNMTLDEIAVRVGLNSASAVSNRLRLLGLPEIVKKELVSGALTEGQARPLLGVDHETISRVLPTLIKDDWSARKIEQFVVEYKKQGKTIIPAKKEAITALTPYREEVECLVRRFKTPVTVKTNSRGGGQIVLKFKTEKEFLRLNDMLTQ